MTLKICTHSGSFHADESLAIALLRRLPAYKDADIQRSRDPAVIAAADIVVDVGGEYDPAKLRFDHHQRGFFQTFTPKHETKLSSAGLIYRHFGKEIVAGIMERPVSDPAVDLLYKRVYEDFVEGFDGIDNGVSQYPENLTPKYKETTNISARVGRLNPWWNQPDTDLFERFMKAVQLTGDEFEERVRYLAFSWLPAREIVLRCLEARTEIHPSGQIMKMDQYCPWKDHLHTLEKELGIPEEKQPLYVLYEDDREKAWRIQAVSLHPGSFQSRKALPEPWRGLRDDVLSETAAIPGAIFIHASGFIGGHKTYDGALQLAVKALAHQPAPSSE